MNKRYDMSAPRQKKDGGTYWVKVGSAFQNEKGIQLVFDALPLPDQQGRCVVSLFEPRNRDEQHRASLNRNISQEERVSRQLDDEIPF